MKIAYFHNCYQWGTYGMQRALYEGLVELGNDVIPINGKNILAKSGDAGGESIRRPDVLKNNIVRGLVENIRPDIIMFASSGMMFDSEHTKHLRKKEISLVGFGFSDPNWFDTRGVIAIRNYDLYFTTSSELLPEIHSITNGELLYPFVYEKFYEDLTPWDERSGIVFVGLGKNHPYYEERLEFVKILNSVGIRVDIYGDGWEELKEQDKGPVYGKRLVEKLNQYKLGLDMTGEKGSIPKRVFEYALCGCAPLVRSSCKFGECFDDGELISMGKGPLLETIGKGFECGKEVVLRAKEKIFFKHSYLHRARFVMDTISEILKRRD